MAGVCTGHVRKSGPGCDHRSVTVALDGETFVLDTGERELDAQAWDDAAKREFIRLGLRRLRALGLALDDAVGRVCNGEEATNVKQYMLLTRDVTKTNIGTSYVNIPPGLNGERSLVEFTGCAEFRIVLNMNFVGTGPMNARVVRDSDNAVLYESPNITGVGEKELDTGWLTIPAAASGLEVVRLQGKSNTGADDPQYRRCVMLVR
jgi:hypothetical protein